MIKTFLYISSIFISMLYSQNIDYPVPKTKNLLFYIQRNHNENTIVYDANFDEEGNLNPKKPVDAYWLRYQEDGRRMELRTFEKYMAYGIKCKKLENSEFDYRLYLSASKKLVFWLKQTAPFKAEIYADVKGKRIKLDHMFANLDESGWLPKVKYGEFFGTDPKTGQKVYIKVFPKDVK